MPHSSMLRVESLSGGSGGSYELYDALDRVWQSVRSSQQFREQTL